MTTIVASLDMMAADTRCDEDGLGTHATKLYRIDGAIIGVGGDNDGCLRFVEWWPQREVKPLKIPKRIDWTALVLTPEGILVYENAGIPDVVREKWAAIGTGKTIALAAMDTMQLLGRKPDPRIALQVARNRDSLTGGLIEHMKLKLKRRA